MSSSCHNFVFECCEMRIFQLLGNFAVEWSQNLKSFYGFFHSELRMASWSNQVLHNCLALCESFDSSMILSKLFERSPEQRTNLRIKASFDVEWAFCAKRFAISDAENWRSIIFNLWKCKIAFKPDNNRQFFILIHRVIQQSHPVCNTIMLFGVITCLISVILLGIDGQFVDSDTYPKVSSQTKWSRSIILNLRSRTKSQ